MKFFGPGQFHEIPKLDSEFEGMDEEQLKQLFERADTALKGEVSVEEVVGLLATVKAIEREFARRGKEDLFVEFLDKLNKEKGQK